MRTRTKLKNGQQQKSQTLNTPLKKKHTKKIEESKQADALKDVWR